MSDLQNLAGHIAAGLGDKLAGHDIQFGELTLEVNRGEH